jgi:cold shock CspA family protein
MNADTVTHIGRVKWFNNKSGYGFVSYKLNGKDEDIFTHHSHIKTTNEQFRYLVQGEYVEFNIEQHNKDTDTSKHKQTAINITGIGGGFSMCETRNSFDSKKNTVHDNIHKVARGSKSGGSKSGGERF